MIKRKTDVETVAELVGEATAAVQATQALGLSVLLTEMQALAQMLPGHDADAPAETVEQRERLNDAAVEAEFDNMPV